MIGENDLVIRPRLYQSEPHRMRTPLDGVLGPLGVSRVAASALPNFLGRCTDPGLVAAAWPARDRERLLAIKRRRDPENLFRLGHAVVPPR